LIHGFYPYSRPCRLYRARCVPKLDRIVTVNQFYSPDGGIPLKYILKVLEQEGVAQQKNQWQAVVNTVINLPVPEEALNFLTQ
jgi:hypothetical protein